MWTGDWHFFSICITRNFRLAVYHKVPPFEIYCFFDDFCCGLETSLPLKLFVTSSKNGERKNHLPKHILFFSKKIWGWIWFPIISPPYPNKENPMNQFPLYSLINIYRRLFVPIKESSTRFFYKKPNWENFISRVRRSPNLWIR